MGTAPSTPCCNLLRPRRECENIAVVEIKWKDTEEIVGADENGYSYAYFCQPCFAERGLNEDEVATPLPSKNSCWLKLAGIDVNE